MPLAQSGWQAPAYLVLTLTLDTTVNPIAPHCTAAGAPGAYNHCHSQLTAAPPLASAAFTAAHGPPPPPPGAAASSPSFTTRRTCCWGLASTAAPLAAEGSAESKIRSALKPGSILPIAFCVCYVCDRVLL